MDEKVEDGRHPVPQVQSSPQEPVADSVYHISGGGANIGTRQEVEEILTMIWGVPAYTVYTRVGGGAHAYYAHDGNGRYCSLEYDHRHGFSIPGVDADMADYVDYNDTRRAASRGVL